MGDRSGARAGGGGRARDGASQRTLASGRRSGGRRAHRAETAEAQTNDTTDGDGGRTEARAHGSVCRESVHGGELGRRFAHAAQRGEDGGACRVRETRSQPTRAIARDDHPGPKMPTMGAYAQRLAPVVRAPQVGAPPRRTAKGTGQQHSEDTVRTQAAPANDDQTRPSLVLPLPVSGLPSVTKRVAAPQK